MKKVVDKFDEFQIMLSEFESNITAELDRGSKWETPAARDEITSYITENTSKAVKAAKAFTDSIKEPDDVEFYAVPMVSVGFSASEFGLLMSNIKSHYDFTVKATAEVGGFMYGAKNRRAFDENDNAVDLDARKLGLLMKSLEYPKHEALAAAVLYTRSANIAIKLSKASGIFI